MKRRTFIAGLGSAAAWPVMSRAQQPTMPVVAFIGPLSAEASVRYLGAFHAGLGELGYVEGRNVVISYHWLNGNYDRIPSIMADLVRRRVAVIASPGGGSQIARAAKAATVTIPIIFGVGENPVSAGLVASLARPGGNATGMNFFMTEAVTKRLGLLRQMIPKGKHGLHDRKVFRLVASQHSARVDAALTIGVSEIGSVTHKSASLGEFASRI